MNPHDSLESADFKSAASASFAIRAAKEWPIPFMVPEAAEILRRNTRSARLFAGTSRNLVNGRLPDRPKP